MNRPFTLKFDKKQHRSTVFTVFTRLEIGSREHTLAFELGLIEPHSNIFYLGVLRAIFMYNYKHSTYSKGPIPHPIETKKKYYELYKLIAGREYKERVFYT